jgi:hypothetical protein
MFVSDVASVHARASCPARLSYLCTHSRKSCCKNVRAGRQTYTMWLSMACLALTATSRLNDLLAGACRFQATTYHVFLDPSRAPRVSTHRSAWLFYFRVTSISWCSTYVRARYSAKRSALSLTTLSRPTTRSSSVVLTTSLFKRVLTLATLLALYYKT